MRNADKQPLLRVFLKKWRIIQSAFFWVRSEENNHSFFLRKWREMISAYLKGGAETTISLLIRKQPFPLGQKKDLLLEKTKQPSVFLEETHKPSPLREKTKKTISLREKTKKTNSLSREFKNKLPPFLEKTTNTQPPFRENVIVLRLLIHPLPLACLESDSMSSVRSNSRSIPGKVGGAQIPGIAALPGRGWAGQIRQRIGGEIEGLKCKSTEKPVARLSSLTDFCKRFRPQEVATLMLPSEREEGERGVNTKQFARHTVPARSTHMDMNTSCVAQVVPLIVCVRKDSHPTMQAYLPHNINSNHNWPYTQRSSDVEPKAHSAQTTGIDWPNCSSTPKYIGPFCVCAQWYGTNNTQNVILLYRPGDWTRADNNNPTSEISCEICEGCLEIFAG